MAANDRAYFAQGYNGESKARSRRRGQSHGQIVKDRNYLTDNLLSLILSDLKRALNQKGLAADWDPDLVPTRFEQNANWQAPRPAIQPGPHDTIGEARSKPGKKRAGTIVLQSVTGPASQGSLISADILL